MYSRDPKIVKCDASSPDNIVSRGWYRMTGNSGDKIPQRCVQLGRCGTGSPGWLNGTHPTVRQGVVIRRVCYHGPGNCCQWHNYIRIRNCRRYYVYQLLKPPKCPLRYCGNRISEYFLSLFRVPRGD